MKISVNEEGIQKINTEIGEFESPFILSLFVLYHNSHTNYNAYLKQEHTVC